MMEEWTYGWGAGWIIMLVLIAAVVIIWYLVKMMKKNAPSGLNKTPGQILDERFAKGEIDEKEYEERKKKLN